MLEKMRLPWCRASRTRFTASFSQYPEYLAFAGGALPVIAIGFKLGSLAR